jgi:branched-chain amino acid transport system substrate-binding protein
MAIATLCEQRQVPFIMDVAALDAITQKGYKYTFRVFITAKALVGGAIKYLKMITDMKGVMPKRAVVTNTAVRQRHVRRVYQRYGKIGFAD